MPAQFCAGRLEMTQSKIHQGTASGIYSTVPVQLARNGCYEFRKSGCEIYGTQKRGPGMILTLKYIIKARLADLGADGLCNPDIECGCSVDDLAPGYCLDLTKCGAAKFVHPKKDDPDYMEEWPEGYFKVI